jgi:hypothetical protein
MLLWGFNMGKNTVPDYRLLKLFNGFHRRSQIPARGAAHRKKQLFGVAPPRVHRTGGDSNPGTPV